MVGVLASAPGLVHALGYEGPESLGAIVLAAAILLGTVVVTLLVVRGLVAYLSRETRRQDPRPGRRR